MSKKSAKNKNSKALALPTIENSDSVTTIAAIETVEENIVDVPEEQPVLIVDAPESAETIIDDLVEAIESSVSNVENPLLAVEQVVVTNEQAIELNEVIADNTENIEQVVEVNEPAIEEAIPVAEAKPKKAGKKPAISNVKAGIERVTLVGTSYHYFRNWLKNTLRSGEIHTAKFIKNEADWNGCISIPESDKDAALKILEQYRFENPETKELWWDVVAIAK
jgi:hypothetical protein